MRQTAQMLPAQRRENTGALWTPLACFPRLKRPDDPAHQHQISAGSQLRFDQIDARFKALHIHDLLAVARRLLGGLPIFAIASAPGRCTLPLLQRNDFVVTLDALCIPTPGKEGRKACTATAGRWHSRGPKSRTGAQPNWPTFNRASRVDDLQRDAVPFPASARAVWHKANVLPLPNRSRCE